ncbi:S8 family serine peptidase, partial [Massilia sp. LXY-6]|uniref:S8 family serine peptidase n=1 Tax=Massilia sp. LXY-6 TaxID=3379823 RepID=UPI003EE1A708
THLRSCAQCREDLDLLHAVRAAGPGPAPDCDPERAWARMLPRIEASPAPAAGAPAAGAPAAGAPAAGVPVRWRDRVAANDRSWLRRAVALQCCLIAVLAALLLRPADEAAYRGLGAAPAVQSGIVVMFRPDTPERELRRIVRASGAHLADGPTAAEAWVLGLPDGGDPARALARLRAEPAVVLAEPLGTEQRP